MHLLAVDDTPSVLLCLELAMRNSGHELALFSDPAIALAHLAANTDLVLSDINMPGMNGFEVADAVAARLGPALPRTLLISGMAGGRDAVEELPPSTVIGLVNKPFKLLALAQVIGLLQQTRSRCPGRILPGMSAAPETCDASCGDETTDSCLCFTDRYGLCPHYNAHGGAQLRRRIESLQV